MKKHFWVLVLALLSGVSSQGSIEEVFSEVEERPNNVPVSYTGTSTTSLSFAQVQVSTSGAGCGTTANWASLSGTFAVSAGSSTLWMNSSTDWDNNRNLALGMCPSGSTSQFVKLSVVRDQSATGCAVNANCFTMTCVSTGVVAGSISGTLPTVTCP